MADVSTPIAARDPALRHWLGAYECTQIEPFLARALPEHWAPIGARILETGVGLAAGPCKWAPRWSPVPPTRRIGRCDDETRMRSIIYRTHDCLHQLWGLPHPGDLHSAADKAYYKRAVMAGEIAVLTLCEFVLCDWLHERFAELRPWIDGRCAVPMRRGPLRGKTITQIALRLDELLHHGRRGRWVQADAQATAFADYYIPMLAEDRRLVDECWAAMHADPAWPNPALDGAPRARFGDTLNGAELTCWMIADFEHLLSTTPEPDMALVRFNRSRRAGIRLPETWPQGVLER